MKIKNTDIYKIYGLALICNNIIHTQQLEYINKIAKKNTDANTIIYDIILKKDDSIDLETIIPLLSQENHFVRKQVRKHVLKLMCLDGKLDSQERVFLAKIPYETTAKDEVIINRYIEKFRRKANGQDFCSKKNELLVKIRLWIYNIIFRDNPMNDILKEKLKFIESNRKLASLFEEKLSSIKVDLTEIQKLLTYNPENSSPYGWREEQKKEIRNEIDEFNQMILNRTPTISFLGNTKAGKSTMFYLLTDAGENLIGEGQQRTTRISVISDIYGVRYIDTPGLNAMKDEGREDEKLAFSMLGQSDLVGYVIPNDSQNQNSTDMIKNVQNMRLPIHYILNFKGGGFFASKKNYEKYLKQNPDGWKDGLEDWLKKVDRDLVNPDIPREKAFLLSARHAKNKRFKIENEKISKDERYILFHHSGFYEALHSLQEDMRENFESYRIAKVSYRISCIIKRIEYDLKEVIEKDNKALLLLDKLKKDVDENIKNWLDEIDKRDIREKWFPYNELEDIVRYKPEDFNNRIIEKIKDLNSDLRQEQVELVEKLMKNLRDSSLHERNYESIFQGELPENFETTAKYKSFTLHEGLQLANTAIGVAGSIMRFFPPGPVEVAGEVLMGVNRGVNLFMPSGKSKSERKEETADRRKDEIEDIITNYLKIRKDKFQKLQEEFNENINDEKEKINKNITETESIIKKLGNAKKNISYQRENHFGLHN